jgi:hypothetical protein
MKKSILFVALLLMISSVSFADTFSDVDGHWAKGAIENLSEYEIVGGYPDGTFKPQSNMTRAEFITTLIKALRHGVDESIDRNWWEKYYARATSEGYITNNNNYILIDPKGNITRGEVIETLYNVIREKNIQYTEKEIPFTDVAKDNDAVKAIYSLAIIGGYPDGTMGLDREITRAEIASIVNSGFLTPRSDQTTVFGVYDFVIHDYKTLDELTLDSVPERTYNGKPINTVESLGLNELTKEELRKRYPGIEYYVSFSDHGEKYDAFTNPKNDEFLYGLDIDIDDLPIRLPDGEIIYDLVFNHEAETYRLVINTPSSFSHKGSDFNLIDSELSWDRTMFHSRPFGLGLRPYRTLGDGSADVLLDHTLKLEEVLGVYGSMILNPDADFGEWEEIFVVINIENVW